MIISLSDPHDANDFQMKRRARHDPGERGPTFQGLLRFPRRNPSSPILRDRIQGDARPPPAISSRRRGQKEDPSDCTGLPRHDPFTLLCPSSPPSLCAGLGQGRLLPGYRNELVRALHAVVGILAEGNAPGASSAALKKKDGGHRPVALGETRRRLTAKVLLTAVSDDVTPFPRPTQLGFATKNGCEATVHAIRRWLQRAHSTRSTRGCPTPPLERASKRSTAASPLPLPRASEERCGATVLSRPQTRTKGETTLFLQRATRPCRGVLWGPASCLRSDKLRSVWPGSVTCAARATASSCSVPRRSRAKRGRGLLLSASTGPYTSKKPPRPDQKTWSEGRSSLT